RGDAMFPLIDRRPRPNEDQQQQPNEDQKPQPPEVWPGAGYGLDWEKIKGDDFDVVERRLKGIDGRGDQISHLLTLAQYFEYETKKVLYRIHEREPEPSCSSKKIRYQAKARLFRERLDRKLEQLRKLQEIEEGTSRAIEPEPKAADSRGAETEAEIEDEPAGEQWSNEKAAIALYALLRAARLPRKHNKSAVARFAHLLTRRSEKRMNVRHLDAVNGCFDDQAAQAVADELVKLGLGKAAADVLKRFQEDD